MKLSDAIALGRTLVLPKQGGEWFPDGSGCARGMALEAVGMGRIMAQRSDKNFHRFSSVWGWTLLPATSCPCGCLFVNGETFSHHIAHFFDYHVSPGIRSLDELIDWIRSVEPKEQETANAEAPVAPSQQYTEAR